MAQLGPQSITDTITTMSHTSIPVSRGMTAPTRITKFDGVSQKKEGARIKQYIFLYSLKGSSCWEVSVRAYGLGLSLRLHRGAPWGRMGVCDCLALGDGCSGSTILSSQSEQVEYNFVIRYLK